LGCGQSSVGREAANRVTINCWYQRQCGAAGVDSSEVRACADNPNFLSQARCEHSLSGCLDIVACSFLTRLLQVSRRGRSRRHHRLCGRRYVAEHYQLSFRPTVSQPYRRVQGKSLTTYPSLVVSKQLAFSFLTAPCTTRFWTTMPAPTCCISRVGSTRGSARALKAKVRACRSNPNNSLTRAR
jgi:hypothetical protein